MGATEEMHGTSYLSHVAPTGSTLSGVCRTTMRSTLSCKISFDATSAALVGLLSVSIALTLIGSFLPNSLMKMPPSLLISAMART